MKRIKTKDGIAEWKIDNFVERILARCADKSIFMRNLYVNFYRIFDREYFNKGLTFIDKYIKLFVGEVTEKQRKEYIYDMVYSLHRFGCMFDEYFYFEFYNLNTLGKSSFITDKTRWDYYSKMNTDENNRILNDKRQAYELFKVFYKRDLLQISSKEDIEELEKFLTIHPRFIVKPIDSSGGRGIYIMDSSEYPDSAVLLDKLIENGAVVIEELIKQVPEMSVLNGSSVNTVRVPTLKLKDRVVIFNPFFRIGRQGAVVDNGFQGGILLAVDSSTGICKTCGFDESGKEYITHPDSNVILPGFQIPKWNQLIELAEKLANVLVDNNYVGWDLALTDKGWVMVEGNPRGQFLTQVITSRGIKHELENYINQM